MAPLKSETIDLLAKRYVELQNELKALRKSLIEEVEAEGATPEKATKMKSLLGEEYELRVTRGIGVSVNQKSAKKIWDAYDLRTFGKMFQLVEKFAIAPGAQKFIDKKTTSQRLRRLFHVAVKMRPNTPKLEVRRIAKARKAA